MKKAITSMNDMTPVPTTISHPAGGYPTQPVSHADEPTHAQAGRPVSTHKITEQWTVCDLTTDGTKIIPVAGNVIWIKGDATTRSTSTIRIRRDEVGAPTRTWKYGESIEGYYFDRLFLEWDAQNSGETLYVWTMNDPNANHIRTV